jgi:D-xylulose reductase
MLEVPGNATDAQLCGEMKFAATPPNIYGTLARYYALPVDVLHRLPDNVTLEDGAMMEPLSVGVHSVKTLGQCTTGEVVIVFGAGPVGLLCMAVAKALGASRIIAVDIRQDKLELAKAYAATDCFLPVSEARAAIHVFADTRLRSASKKSSRDDGGLPGSGDGYNRK